MRASTPLHMLQQRQATAALIVLTAALTGPATAQVVFDGATCPGGALSGPDYQITDDLGTRAGDILFDNFSEFSIGIGESVTFSGPDEIANVVSRVTGSNPSDITWIIGWHSGPPA